jgi:hypothetical protein
MQMQVPAPLYLAGGDINTALAFVKQKMGPQGLLGLSSALQKLKEQSQVRWGVHLPVCSIG